MDISSIYQSNNVSNKTNSGGTLGYDLELEKQEIEKITREIKSELLAKWKKSYANAQIFPAPIAAMHPEVVNFLLSFELVGIYDNIARQAGLDENGRSSLPQIIWQIAQSKKWEDLDQLLEAEIPMVHSAHVTVANLLKQNILNKARILNEKTPAAKISVATPAKKEIHLPLAEILLQYPKVSEQNITTEQIRLQSFPTPVRPSVKNWISSFHEAMGAGKHSPIDRGNFLFHSGNGKALSSSERQKVAIILKSLDEKTLLAVDPVSESISFNAEEIPTSQANNSQVVSAPKAFAPISFNSESEIGKVENQIEKPKMNDKTEFRATVSPRFNPFSSSDNSTIAPGRNFEPPVIKKSFENVQRPADDVIAEKSVDFDQKQNGLDGFHSLDPASNPIEPQSAERKSAVVLKEMAFDPSLVKTPDNSRLNEESRNDFAKRGATSPNFAMNKSARAALDLSFSNKTAATGGNEKKESYPQKEEIFSISTSKPPLGTDEYHMKEREIDTTNDALKTEALKNKAILGQSIISKIRSKMVDSRLEKQEEEINDAPKEVSIVKAIAPEMTITHAQSFQNSESLSDDMLLKMYREKVSNDNVSAKSALAQQNVSPRKSTVNPYHISPSTDSENESDAMANLKNVVNLREQ